MKEGPRSDSLHRLWITATMTQYEMEVSPDRKYYFAVSAIWKQEHKNLAHDGSVTLGEGTLTAISKEV